MKIKSVALNVCLLAGAVFFISACSTGPEIIRTLDVPASADTPYDNILVVALFDDFEIRKRLEKAVVERLSGLGAEAVASTSLMKTTTPMTRETYLAMVNKLSPDALLVTQLVNARSKVSMTESASPKATYNVSPTYYFNVWEVELTEYKEPEMLELQSKFSLATELYSVASRERVWAIESSSSVVGGYSIAENYMVFIDEGNAIVDFMLKDGLIDPSR